MDSSSTEVKQVLSSLTEWYERSSSIRSASASSSGARVELSAKDITYEFYPCRLKVLMKRELIFRLTA